MPTSWGAGQVTDCGRTVGAAAGNTSAVRAAAVRVVASAAVDVDDARRLLEQLGLGAVEGKEDGAGGMNDHWPEPPDGFAWAWIPTREIPHDNRWEVVPEGKRKQCRASDDGTRCRALSQARLNRAQRSETPQWWHYCRVHLYGRRVWDGEVQARILAPTGPLLERGLE